MWPRSLRTTQRALQSAVENLGSRFRFQLKTPVPVKAMIALSQGITTLAQGFGPLAGVPSADCASIVSAAREKRFARGQILFSEGDPVSQVILLLSGCVKITQVSPNGDEVILRLSLSSEIVGAFSRFSKHYSTAQAIRPCTALVWDAANFEQLLGRSPKFYGNVVRALEERLRAMEQRFWEVSTACAESRLSSELLRLSDRLGAAAGREVEITLSRAELAQLTGTTLFTVSRLLCHWQSLGMVKIRRGGVQVRDFRALAHLVQRK